MRRVRTRKRGKTWSYAFEAGRTEDGKRHAIERGGYATRDEAYAAGAEAYTDWQHGNIGITDEHITLRSYLESWLENVSRPSVRISSYNNYRGCLKRIPALLGNTELDKLTPAMLDLWIRSMVKKNLSRATISSTLKVVRTALSYAIYPAGLISSNPALYVKVPRVTTGRHVERRIITPENLEHLLAVNPPGSEFYIPLLLLYHTGMRVSEVCGLVWDDIDLDTGMLHVRRQLERISPYLYLTEPKTATSVRDIQLDTELIDLLADWWMIQQENEEKYGDAYIYCYVQDGKVIRQSRALPAPLSSAPVNLVCTQPAGAPTTAVRIDTMLMKYGYNSHSFRHTHATVLIEHGAPAKGVAARLGHASTKITEDLYTHETKKNEERYGKNLREICQMQTRCRQKSPQALNNKACGQ